MAEQEILTLIGNYAFPIVACIAMFWKMNRDGERHKEEMDALRASLDANTTAVKDLTYLIKRSAE